jgi:hypothetical protein
VNKHEDGWLVDGADVMLNVPSDDERALNYLPIFGNQIAAAVKMYRELEGALPKSVSDLMKKDYLAGLPANPGGAPWVINADKKTISVALPPDLCAQLNQKMTEAGDSRGSCENGEYSQLF